MQMDAELRQALLVFAYAMLVCLVVNDAVKVALIRWRLRAVER